MEYFEKNRVFPVRLSVIIVTFSICFHGNEKFFDNHPSASYINDMRIQFVIFIVLGFCLVWGLYACNRERQWILWKGIGVGSLFLAYLKIYNTISGRIVYNVSSKAGALGIVIGSTIFYLMNRFSSSKRKEQQSQKNISLDSVSKYRNQLMGIAMLYIMLFHTTITKADYGDGIFYLFVKLGNLGVDVFLFLSGIGMTYSLNKNFDIVNFYKKRVLRIYPYYIPIVGFYSLVCWILGLCSVGLVLTNCLGVSFWISDSAYAFNWYIPAAMIFFLWHQSYTGFWKITGEEILYLQFYISSQLYLW